jgi:hypothetical protein
MRHWYWLHMYDDLLLMPHYHLLNNRW